jgi:hypothetical protein
MASQDRKVTSKDLAIGLGVGLTSWLLIGGLAVWWFIRRQRRRRVEPMDGFRRKYQFEMGGSTPTQSNETLATTVARNYPSPPVLASSHNPAPIMSQTIQLSQPHRKVMREAMSNNRAGPLAVAGASGGPDLPPSYNLLSPRNV